MLSDGMGTVMGRLFHRAAAKRPPLVGFATVVIASFLGCGPPKAEYPAALHSERPDERAAAIRHAGETRDRAVMGILVDRLDDEDEAVRMFAILALERITGTRLGYDYHDSALARSRAVERWRRHLAESRPAAEVSG